MTSPDVSLVLAALVCLTSVAPAGALGQAGGAVVSGIVRDARSDSSIRGATAFLLGTLLTAVSNDSGRFRLAHVPPARYTVRVLAVGYLPDTVSTGELVAGAQQSVVIRLHRSSLALPEVVVTADQVLKPADRAPAHYGLFQVPSQYRFTSDRLADAGVQVMHSERIGNFGTRLEVGRETSDGSYENGQYSRWFARGKLTSAPLASHPWDAYAIWSRNDSGNFLEWKSADHPFEVDSSYWKDHSVYEAFHSGVTVTPVVAAAALLKVSPYLNYNANQDYFQSDHERPAHPARAGRQRPHGRGACA